MEDKLQEALLDKKFDVAAELQNELKTLKHDAPAEEVTHIFVCASLCMCTKTSRYVSLLVVFLGVKGKQWCKLIV